MADHTIRVGDARITSVTDGHIHFQPSDFFPSIDASEWTPYQDQLTDEGLIRMNVGSCVVSLGSRRLEHCLVRGRASPVLSQRPIPGTQGRLGHIHAPRRHEHVCVHKREGYVSHGRRSAGTYRRRTGDCRSPDGAANSGTYPRPHQPADNIVGRERRGPGRRGPCAGSGTPHGLESEGRHESQVIARESGRTV